jgi:hypothetical protein
MGYLTAREQHRLRRVSDNRVLGTICGCEGEEVTGGWRKLREEELHKLYSSLSTIRMMKSRTRLARNSACMRQMRNI